MSVGIGNGKHIPTGAELIIGCSAVCRLLHNGAASQIISDPRNSAVRIHHACRKTHCVVIELRAVSFRIHNRGQPCPFIFISGHVSVRVCLRDWLVLIVILIGNRGSVRIGNCQQVAAGAVCVGGNLPVIIDDFDNLIGVIVLKGPCSAVPSMNGDKIVSAVILISRAVAGLIHRCGQIACLIVFHGLACPVRIFDRGSVKPIVISIDGNVAIGICGGCHGIAVFQCGFVSNSVQLADNTTLFVIGVINKGVAVGVCAGQKKAVFIVSITRRISHCIRKGDQIPVIVVLIRQCPAVGQGNLPHETGSITGKLIFRTCG